MKIVNMTVASAALLALSASAQASDEGRGGLLLGLGVGSSSINTSVEPLGGEAGSNVVTDESGAAFSFRIGGAVGQKSAVYLLAQAGGTEAELVHTLTGIGASYYFKKSGASLYLTGGYGFGAVSFSENEVPEGTGTAFMGGIGLELGWGLNVELNHMRVNTTPESIEGEDIDGVNYDIASTQFLIGYTWF